MADRCDGCGSPVERLPDGRWAHSAITVPVIACDAPRPADMRIAKTVTALDAVSRLLSRAGGMALAAGLPDLATLIGEAGCDLDTVINDLEDDDAAT